MSFSSTVDRQLGAEPLVQEGLTEVLPALGPMIIEDITFMGKGYWDTDPEEEPESESGADEDFMIEPEDGDGGTGGDSRDSWGC